MRRNKAKDDKMFNCSQQHERAYVANLYSEDKRENVLTLLKEACENNEISNSTHDEVYDLIKKKLGLSIPS